MRIQEINENTVFIKKYDGGYLASDETIEGYRVVSITDDIFKAKRFSVKDVLIETYKTLSENQITKLYSDNWETILNRIDNTDYIFLGISKIDNGYSGDKEHEQELIKKLDVNVKN